MMECIALLSSAAMTFVSDSTAASRSSLRSCEQNTYPSF